MDQFGPMSHIGLGPGPARALHYSRICGVVAAAVVVAVVAVAVVRCCRRRCCRRRVVKHVFMKHVISDN